MIQPSIRPAGSSHLIRFVGTLQYQDVVGATVQVVNGEIFPSPATADVSTPVVFALADMTDLDDTQTRLLESIFDDSTPAGSSPHVNGFGGPGAGSGVGPAWAQNIRVRAQELEPSTATPLIARIDVLTPVTVRDGAAGSGFGLEQDTGVPCVLLGFHFTAAGITRLGNEQEATIPIVIEVEVPHTIGR